jgi:hypothetical protein
MVTDKFLAKFLSRKLLLSVAAFLALTFKGNAVAAGAVAAIYVLVEGYVDSRTQASGGTDPQA